MSESTPYHDGELLVQRRAGQSEIGRRNGSVIKDTIIKGAIRFVAQQPLVVLGSIDEAGRVWASILVGRPGFMTADERTIEFDLRQAVPIFSDPLWRNIELNADVGTLIIELKTRRRLRVNGLIERVNEDLLRLSVKEAYPNCPKYIQRRVPSFELNGKATRPTTVRREGISLSDEQQALIGNADTLFVTSARPDTGADASHRGGNPGFVRIIDDRTLRIPDYVGNSMFNTLGNFVANPQAGLLFVDFDGGRVLQLVGMPTILWDLDIEDHETGGTRRYWELAIEQWIETEIPVSSTWEFVDYSPFNV